MTNESKQNSLAVFKGLHAKSIDAKNRIGIPGPFRSLLPETKGGKIFIVRGIDPDANYLEAWTEDAWQQISEEVQALPNALQRRQMLKGYISQANDCKVDGQGRIVVPPYFREWAGLTGEVLWIGSGRMMELWSKTNFEDHEKELRTAAFNVFSNNPDHFSG